MDMKMFYNNYYIYNEVGYIFSLLKAKYNIRPKWSMVVK